MTDDRESFMAVVAVTDELPGMPPRVEADRPYTAVVGQLMNTVSFLESEIEARVKQRADINGEIKVLRDELDRAQRMLRIAQAPPPKGARGDE